MASASASGTAGTCQFINSCEAPAACCCWPVSSLKAPPARRRHHAGAYTSALDHPRRSLKRASSRPARDTSGYRVSTAGSAPSTCGCRDAGIDRRAPVLSGCRRAGCAIGEAGTSSRGIGDRSQIPNPKLQIPSNPNLSSCDLGFGVWDFPIARFFVGQNPASLRAAVGYRAQHATSRRTTQTRSLRR